MDKPIFEKMFNFTQEYPFIGKFAAWFALTVAKFYYLAYIVGAVLLFMAQDRKIVIYLLFPAMTLATSYTFRQAIKRLRPYEEYPIKPFIETKKKLYSMPSNHSASALIIGLAYLYVYPIAGWILILVAFLTGISRVLSGIHYPFDACVGWLIALIYGSVMLYILF